MGIGVLDLFFAVCCIFYLPKTQNNIGIEDAAKSTAYIIFDSRGLNEQDLRNIYDNSEIYIAYKLKNSDLVEKRVSIGDNLKTNE